MSNIVPCLKCGKDNSEPHYRACPTCRAKWRAQKPRKRPISLPYGYIALKVDPSDQVLSAIMDAAPNAGIMTHEAKRIWQAVVATAPKEQRAC